MYKLPELGYDYAALQPSISAEIMRLHHDTHHQGYVDKLNAALQGNDALQALDIEQLLGEVATIDDTKLATAIRNQGGGHYNHSLFWQMMSPDGGGEAKAELLDALNERYGSFQSFVDEFTSKSASVFGSGWCWLMPNMDIITTPNQDNPLMNGESAPILGLDVWEHAYYLDYHASRADYVKAWWDVVNWDFVNERWRGK